MIIHSPIFSGSISQDPNNAYANLSGSFTGSFTGVGNFVGLEADSVEFDNILNKPSLVSGSSQVSYPDLSNIPSGIVSSSAQLSEIFLDTLGDGVVSGSSQVSYPDLSNIPAGIVSGSSQVIGILDSLNTHSGSTDSRLSNLEAETGSIASEQSAQDSRLSNLESATSSYQPNLSVSDTTTINLTLSSNTLSADAIGGLVSGSSQVSYPSLSNIPSGIISGSSQLPSGVISGSSQVQAGSITGDIALGTQTSGDYVQNLGTGTGVTIGSNSGEGSTPTIAVNYGSTANTAVQGNTNFTLNGTANEIDVTGTAAQALGGGPSYTVGLADTITGNRTFSNNVTISGNLTVSGTTTQVNSTTVQIGDNIIELNGSGATNGGIYVKDATASTLVTGSLLWDTTNDKWIAGPLGSEVEVVTISGTQTLTNKTINGSQLVDASVTNAKLANSTISGISLGSNLASLSAGTGISLTAYNGSTARTISATDVYNRFQTIAVSGQSSVVADSTSDTLTLVAGTNVSITTDAATDSITINSTDQYVGTVTSVATGTGLTGGTITSTGTISLSHLGIQSLTDPNADRIFFWDDSAGTSAWLSTGTGISISGTTISNSGVTSITGTANQVIASASTGAITLSLPQSIATTSTVQFGKVGVGGASDATYELKVTGDIGATGDIVAYVSSDKRLKDNIKNIENPIEKVQALNGVTWEWNDLASEAAKQSPNVGVIAQEVEEVLPQLVHDRENGFKGVDYAKLTGLLIEAIKEQQKQIEELKSKLG